MRTLKTLKISNIPIYWNFVFGIFEVLFKCNSSTLRWQCNTSREMGLFIEKKIFKMPKSCAKSCVRQINACLVTEVQIDITSIFKGLQISYLPTWKVLIVNFLLQLLQAAIHNHFLLKRIYVVICIRLYFKRIKFPTSKLARSFSTRPLYTLLCENQVNIWRQHMTALSDSPVVYECFTSDVFKRKKHYKWWVL